MRYLLLYSFLFCLNISFSQLILEWEVFHPLKKEWIKYGKSGSIQELLIQRGELSDPFVGENETQFAWIENHQWQFRSSFIVADLIMKSQYIDLHLPSVDTYAKISLNDTVILQTSNAFVPYRIHIKDGLRSDTNWITALFTSPIQYHATSKEENDIFYPAPNDVGSTQIAPLTRKPQYQFGWDWALRMNIIGFLKPVTIENYDLGKIINTKIETQQILTDTANMLLTVQFSSDLNGKVLIESNRLGSLKDVEIEHGKIDFPFEIIKPKLWWPRGQGESYLYHDKLYFYTTYGKLIDSISVSYGVRTSQLIQEKDSVGTSYLFKINDRPIFCKGANYIPQDVFPSRVTKEKIKTMVLAMVEANFNIVRVWGGGYYPDDYFYELCDQYGIMVWQDFMFACAMYPADELFLVNVEKELKYQVPRIASHPCVIQFNGNNEVDVAWKNWGFQSKYQISTRNQKIIQDAYVKLFKVLIPTIVRENCMIPYIHTSPLGHWTNKEEYPHGTQHYWGVWHGKDKMEDFGFKSGRFNAEYGFQSFPEYSTLASFSKQKDWNLESSVMKQHQKSYVGNGMIKKHSDNLFGEARSFEEFVYFSQLTQAKAVSIAVSAHRLSAPICMGTIYWQLNDCWPAPTWSSIDYYGNWKALHYQVKEDYQDVTVLEKTEIIGKEKYYFISDLPKSFQTTVNYTVSNLLGQTVTRNSIELNISSTGINKEVAFELQKESYINSNYVVQFDWKNEYGETKTRSFTHIGAKSSYNKANENDIALYLEDIDTNQRKCKLRITNKQFVHKLWITSLKQGVKFETNFNSYLPGSHIIEIRYEGDCPTLTDFTKHWL
jgi:beta-mannosidase